METNVSKKSNFTKEGIVVPPGCDNTMLHQCGEPVATYTPASYSPYTPTSFPPHAMHGKGGGISIPKGENSLSQKCLSEYLNQFCGAELCLDLWFDTRTRIKKCGILAEVGTDFLAMKETSCQKIILIDLKPVRYINIYCK